VSSSRRHVAVAEATGFGHASSTPLPHKTRDELLSAYVLVWSQRFRVLLPDCRRPAERLAATGRGRYCKSRAAIPPERWAEVATAAERDGLRATARQYQVSHEAIRQVVRRVRAVAAAD
jgi:hypothetical protein